MGGKSTRMVGRAEAVGAPRAYVVAVLSKSRREQAEVAFTVDGRAVLRHLVEPLEGGVCYSFWDHASAIAEPSRTPRVALLATLHAVRVQHTSVWPNTLDERDR